MATYSMDLRQRVVRACDSGMPAAAWRRGLSEPGLGLSLAAAPAETGSIAPRKQTKFRAVSLSGERRCGWSA